MYDDLRSCFNKYYWKEVNTLEISKLKVQNSKLRRSGFTLIELLVVVTLIAILAVAVLATINPIEQRNKARDTAVKQTAAEIVAAEERYYATYGCYTWEDTAAGAGVCTVSSDPSATAIDTSSLNLGFLSTQGEVKPNLISRLASEPYSDIVITEDSDRILHASFVPTSKSFESKGVWTTTCAASTGGTSYCVPDTLE